MPLTFESMLARFEHTRGDIYLNPQEFKEYVQLLTDGKRFLDLLIAWHPSYEREAEWVAKIMDSGRGVFWHGREVFRKEHNKFMKGVIK